MMVFFGLMSCMRMDGRQSWVRSLSNYKMIFERLLYAKWIEFEQSKVL
jgi:hypothetical protein